MNITNDMKNLTEQQRRTIARFANTLLKKLPTIHTIIMTRKPGLKTASVLTDYELIIFACDDGSRSDIKCKKVCDDIRKILCDGVNDSVSDVVGKNKNPKSSVPDVYAAVGETYPICNPQMDYVISSRLVDKEESEALTYGFKDVHEDTRNSFLECLRKHLMFFVKRESMSVTTVNTTEMHKKDRLYHRLYMIFKLETGYVLYNRDTRPMVTLQIRL